MTLRKRILMGTTTERDALRFERLLTRLYTQRAAMFFIGLGLGLIIGVFIVYS
jgi:hypothetical protein